MRKFLILVVLLLAGAGAYWYFGPQSRWTPSFSTQNLGEPDLPPGSEASAPLPAEKFSGELEEVNTGCFADAECYAIVDGKHVTILMGRTISPTIVGQVLGVPTIGDLEAKIGSNFEVYAQKKSEGTYTLHGNENFYIKLKQ